MRALIVDNSPAELSKESDDLLRSIGWQVTRVDGYAAAIDTVSSGGTTEPADAFDAMLISIPLDDERDRDHRPSRVAGFSGSPPADPGGGIESGPAKFDDLIDLAEERRLPALVLTDQPELARSSGSTLVDWIGRSISPAELKGRLEIIQRYQPLFRRMDRQVSQMRKLTQQLDRQFREIDQEMRLAGRLQRDFLPALDAPIQNIRFATIYRPAVWVSGDTFDVFRVTENLTAVYVADAVGHGMAASLLTMFIRRAIVSKQISDDGFRVLTPSETMAGLNTALIDQALPNSRFVTACYMLIDHRSLKVTFSNGGHPYPIVLSPDGSMRELEATGALLGIFEDAEFPMAEAQLHPGDKLLIYTDGMELAFDNPSGLSGEASGKIGASHLETFRAHGSLPIKEMMQQLETKMDRVCGSLAPCDDVTIVGLECLEA